jgi:hypothetical protein
MKHVDCPPNLRSNPEDGFEVYITTSVVADNAICSKQIYLKFNKVFILLENEKELTEIDNRIRDAIETLKSRAAPGERRVTFARNKNEENLS